MNQPRDVGEGTVARVTSDERAARRDDRQEWDQQTPSRVADEIERGDHLLTLGAAAVEKALRPEASR